MALSRIWRLLPAKHLVITFTVMNLLLMLLYRRMSQIYKHDVTIASTDSYREDGHDSQGLYKLERSGRDLREMVNNSEDLNDTSSRPMVTSELQTGVRHVVGDFILQPTIDCNAEDLFVIYIYSEVGNRERRDLIRQTWGNLSRYEQRTEYTLVLFFVTGSSENRQLMSEIEHEAGKFKDLLVANFEDSEINSTLKGLNALSWIRSNCDIDRIQFAFKTDDDVFVNVHSMIDYVSGMMTDANWDFLCLLNRSDAEQRPGRSVYCSRLGYGMNARGLRRVTDSCFQKRILPAENYFFTRFCLKKAFPDAAIRYKQLCKSGCLLDSGSLKTALSPERIQNLAQLILVHPLPPEYWHQVYDVTERLYESRASADFVT